MSPRPPRQPVYLRISGLSRSRSSRVFRVPQGTLEVGINLEAQRHALLVGGTDPHHRCNRHAHRRAYVAIPRLMRRESLLSRSSRRQSVRPCSIPSGATMAGGQIPYGQYPCRVVLSHPDDRYRTCDRYYAMSSAAHPIAPPVWRGGSSALVLVHRTETLAEHFRRAPLSRSSMWVTVHHGEYSGGSAMPVNLTTIFQR
jgi:hypothetical protein